MKKIIPAVYLVSLFLLTAYSFSETDNLLISPLLIIPRFQMGLFLTVDLILLFGCYFYFLKVAASFSKRKIFFLGFLTVILSFFAYPASFSHDVFNYLFDAKILSYYHQLPWFTSPSQFPGDYLLSFVHWPTSSSRYGPVWVSLSTLFSLLVKENILLGIYAIKLLTTFSFLICLHFLIKIGLKTKKNIPEILSFIIFNPFFIIEGLISPHTDSLMAALAIVSLYFLLSSKFKPAFFGYFGSIMVKIVSLPLIVPFLLNLRFHLKKESTIQLFVIFSYFGALIISAKWSINAWYFLTPLLFSSLLIKRPFYKNLAITLSFATLIRYLPYSFWGYFNPQNKIRAILFLISFVPFGFWVIKKYLLQFFRIILDIIVFAGER